MRVPIRLIRKIIPHIAEFAALVLVSIMAGVCSSAAQKIGMRFSKKRVYNKDIPNDYQI